MTRTCKNCGPTPLSGWKAVKNRHGHTVLRCIECARKSSRESSRRALAKRRAYKRTWREKNRDRVSAVDRAWREANAQRRKARTKELLAAHRMDILRHYSGGDPKCACCGETELAFLTLDHVYGGGNRHKAEIRRFGFSFYVWIKKNGFPAIFQVLCFNCNCAKGANGICPHMKRKVA